jgi:hypothetical protein
MKSESHDRIRKCRPWLVALSSVPGTRPLGTRLHIRTSCYPELFTISCVSLSPSSLAFKPMAMRSEPTSEQIQTAVSAGNVFSSRAELIEFAKQLEGFDFDSYNGVWAIWNGNIVGAVASDQYSKSLQTAVLEEGQCSQRADQIMEAANTLESAGNVPEPNK